MTHQPASGSSAPGHRRLAYCTAASAVAILGFIVFFHWPESRRDSTRAPVLELTLPRDEPEPLAEPPAERPPEPPIEEPPIVEEEPVVEEPDVIEPPQPAAEQDEVPAVPSAGDDVTPAEQPEIDWQASLERASAEIVRRYSEVPTLHPEFEELRRVAAERYAEPRTGKPPPIGENVETDIYGRRLLDLGGGCYKVLDDFNVGNRYAFETFEQHMTFCYLAKSPRQKFPWIETIRERYPYLREPDGGWLQKAATGPENSPSE